MEWGIEQAGIRYLSVENLIEINVEAISFTPMEQVGVFSRDNLESVQQKQAIFRCYTGCNDIFTLAAVLFIGVAQGHCFSNGNKRSAFMSSFAFLMANGFVFEPCTDSSIETALLVVQNIPDYCDPYLLSSWFKAFSREITGDEKENILKQAKKCIKQSTE
jgi:death-on-curing protein